MAQQTLSFYKGNSPFSGGFKKGCIYFDDTDHLLKVGKGEGVDPDIYSGVQSAEFENSILTIINQDGKELKLDFSDVASAEGVTSLLSGLRDDIESVKSSVAGLGKPAVLYTEETAAAKNAETGAVEGDDNFVKAGDVAEEATGIYADVEKVKEELGQSAADGAQSLSDRIEALEDALDPEKSGVAKDVEDIKSALGNDGSNGEDKSGIYADIEAIEDKIGNSESGLVKDVADNASAISTLQDVVGDSTSGLVADVEAIKEQLGDKSGEESINERIDGIDELLNGKEATDEEEAVPGLIDRIESLENAGYLTEVPVAGIAEGEKIISLSGDKKISSTLKMSYDSDAHELKLLGINDEQIGEAIDCSDFIADGVLDNVEKVTLEEGDVDGLDAGDYFKFSWSTAADKEPIYVALEKFAVSEYEAGKDLKLTDGVFDIALDEDIEISGVQVGNLGVDVLKLDKGMSLSEILTAMLCKDIDVKENAKPSLSAISSTLSGTSFEVGDVVPAFTLTVSYNDGSFVSADDKLYSAAKFEANNGASPLAAGCEQSDTTWTGATKDAEDKNKASVASFTITSSGKTIKVKSAYGASSVTPKTLLNNDSEVVIAAANTAEKSYTLSAYYKDFYGAVPAEGTDISTAGLQSVDGLTLSGVKHSTSAFKITCEAGTKGAYIWTKSTVKSFKNGTDEFVNDLKCVDVDYTNGETTTTYHLYTFPNVAGYVQKTVYDVTLN